MDGIFTQSNYGVVTKMSRFLIPEPETYLSCEANCFTDAGLEPLVDGLRRFELDETIRNPVVVTNAALLASFTSVRSQWYDGDGPVPSEVFDQIQTKPGSSARWPRSPALNSRRAVTIPVM